MQLQTPDLVPFENLELKREFEAVTLKMQKHLNLRIIEIVHSLCGILYGRKLR